MEIHFYFIEVVQIFDINDIVFSFSFKLAGFFNLKELLNKNKYFYFFFFHLN